MKTLALALASTLAAGPAFAGVYVNVESNASYTGADYETRTTDFHVGYEDTAGAVDWYVQGGPAVVAADAADESDNQLSGIRAAFTQKGFLIMNNNCCDCYEITDSPSTVITYQGNGPFKQIEHYYGCDNLSSRKLTELETIVLEVTGVDKLVEE